MNTTDNPGFVLDILSNILETAKGREELEYELGSLIGLSEGAEKRILLVLQSEKLLIIKSTRPSGAFIVQQQDDFDPLYSLNVHSSLQEPRQSLSMAVNRPSVAVLKVNSKKIRNKIKLLKISLDDKLLIQDDMGNFILKGEMLKKKNGQPIDKTTKYYNVLDILFNCGDLDGRVPLNIFIRELHKRKIWEKETKEKIEQNIRMTFINGLFHSVWWKNIKLDKESLSNGNRLLIETYKSPKGKFEGWKLNNVKK